MFSQILKEKSAFFARSLALLLWAALIFFFSSLPGEPVYHTASLAYLIERKGAHLIEYFVLTILALRFFFFLFPKELLRGVLALSMVFSLAYAASDELHQFFVPFREPKVTDVLIDGAGILLAALFVLLFHRQAFRSEKRK